MVRQLLIFVGVLMALNALFYVMGLNFRISILGSILLSAVVTLIMGMFQKR